LVAGLVSCNSFDAPIEESDGSRLVIPTDVRRPVYAANKPPPVSGGTLLVTRASGLAVASDPERDAIVVARLGSGTLLGSIALEKGDEPGRLVEDAAGRVHVALRRGGAIVTVDPSTLSVLDRRPVCGAPRGLALSTPETLEIACADGKLVTLPTGAGGVTRTVALEPDLRDVVVNNGTVSVTRFKSAEVLRLDAAGAVTRRDHPTAVFGMRTIPVEGSSRNDIDLSQQTVQQSFRPLVAWRALPGPNGSTVIVHQRAVEAPIEIAQPTQSGSSYGGSGFSCSGIVENAITVMSADGATANMTFTGPPLPVDAALSPDGRRLIIAHAGPADPGAPRPFVVFDDTNTEGASSGGGSFGGPGMGTLSLVDIPSAPTGPASPEGTIAPDPTCTFSGSLPLTDPAVAVAFNPAQPAQLVIQTRQPSAFIVVDNLDQAFNLRSIPFDDGTTFDTGYELFHRDSGGGIACATCHAEGAEDGNVWRFADVGDRRTQALNLGLRGTAPFHWDGKLDSVGALMNEVFVGRMGGIHESPARLRGLEDWIFAQTPPAPLRRADEAAVERGKALFEAQSTGCTSCHWGSHFTNNDSRDVGTSTTQIFQVPSLVGIGYRAPFMHDGCATTLAGRFDPACGGGEKHGHTAELAPEQIADLVAYLESL
jgi:hypothetical protein